jgi:hypothetical protein
MFYIRRSPLNPYPRETTPFVIGALHLDLSKKILAKPECDCYA